MRTSFFLWSSALTLIVSGCGDKKATNDQAGTETAAVDKDAQPSGNVAAPADATPADSETTAPQPGDGPVIRLLEPGQEPRFSVHYAAAKASTQKVTATLEMSTHPKLASNPMPKMKLPKFSLEMVVNVGETTVRGETAYELAVNKVQVGGLKDVDPMMAQLAAKQMQPVEGLTGRSSMSPQGINGPVTFRFAKGDNPKMTQLLSTTKEFLEQPASPLPSEPVGAGAKWQVVRAVGGQGFAKTQTATYEVTEISESGLKAKVTILEIAGRQVVSMPGMPVGSSAELHSMEGKGEGEIHLSFDRLLPKSATMSVRSTSAFSMSAKGETQKMGLEAELTMTLVSK